MKTFRSIIKVIATAALASMALGSTAGELTGANWPEYHGDWRGWRYSPLDQINKGNVKKLKVAWIHQPGEIVQGLQASPIILDGIVYYSASNNRTYAVDGKTGKQIWEFIPELDAIQGKSVYGFYNRGITVGRGKVFIGASDGHLIALDQKTGKQVWKTKLTDPKTCHGCNFTSPPILAGGVLIAGPTGGDVAQRSKLYALKADTGENAWTLDLLKDDPKSWTPEAIKVGGGGAWLPGQYDEKNNTFFIGTANPAPDLNIANRPGDNLYTSTVLALEPETGKIKWHHQETPNDAWDFDSAYEFVMFEHGGKELMLHLNKGGFVYVYDRKSGQLQNVWQLAKEMNWIRGVDPKTGELLGRNNPLPGKSDVFCPSVLGARSWNAGAYSPKTKLWYTNAYDICMRVVVGEQKVDKLAFSQPYYDVAEFEVIAPPNKKPTSRLAAYDPMTGKTSWQVDFEVPGLAHVLATAGGLIFNGDPRGTLSAYDDETGKEVWNFNVGSGMRGGIASYQAGGKQYIVAATGFGSLFPGFASIPWPEFKNVRGGAALVAFTLE
jgi:alcohol dehydrogenase (cytochrome c)